MYQQNVLFRNMDANGKTRAAFGGYRKGVARVGLYVRLPESSRFVFDVEVSNDEARGRLNAFLSVEDCRTGKTIRAEWQTCLDAEKTFAENLCVFHREAYVRFTDVYNHVASIVAANPARNVRALGIANVPRNRYDNKRTIHRLLWQACEKLQRFYDEE